MTTASKPRSRGRGTNGTHVPPETLEAGEPKESDVNVNREALARVSAALDRPAAPIFPDNVRFGVMTERGYIPRPRTARILCPLYLPDIELYVTFNTSIAYGYIDGGYQMPGDTPVERMSRKLALMIIDFEGWNFFDPWKNEPVPKPDPDDWESFKPLVMAGGLLTPLGGWCNGDGLITALNSMMGNSSPA